ncbi:hypothetical protein BsWGS_27050 [Bradybaena similaris]
MPFGLKGRPATYMSLMDEVLKGLQKFAHAYIDDILIHTSGSIEDHLKHVQIVFNRLRQHNIKLKLSRCEFLKPEIKYLGFIVTRDGIRPDDDKVKAIRDLPIPRSVREVRGFIGMCGYYRQHIVNFSKAAEPLINLTKKYARFNWTPACDRAFQYLKDALTATPLLAHPDQDREMIHRRIRQCRRRMSGTTLYRR